MKQLILVLGLFVSLVSAASVHRTLLVHPDEFTDALFVASFRSSLPAPPFGGVECGGGVC